MAKKIIEKKLYESLSKKELVERCLRYSKQITRLDDALMSCRRKKR